MLILLRFVDSVLMLNMFTEKVQNMSIVQFSRDLKTTHVRTVHARSIILFVSNMLVKIKRKWRKMSSSGLIVAKFLHMCP